MNRRAFTLVELLMSVGVVAVLASVVVFIVNPTEILRKSRDSVRLSDIKTIDGMASAYQQAVTGASLGTVGVTYISIPDPRATSTAGTDCAGLGAPFSGGGAFHCAASSTLRKVDGTGWIPLNLAAAPYGLTIGALPVDPVNITSSNQYYEYQADATTYEIKAQPESQTYVTTAATKPTLFTRGTNLNLIIGTYLSQFGSSGTGAGQFTYPRGVAIDSSGNIYVPDSGNARVEEFNSGGTFVKMWGWGVQDGASSFETCTSGCRAGTAGSGVGQLYGPQGVALDSSGNIYIVDGSNSRIQEFSSNNVFIKMWGWGVQDGASHFETCTTGCQQGIQGSGNGQFYQPTGIAIDSSGNIYVADPFNNNVQKFNSSAAFVYQFGSFGTGINQFNGSWRLAVDSSGNIYVTDITNNRVEKFDSSGSFVSTWGWGVQDGANAYEICTVGCQAGISGAGNGQFQYGPNGIAIDSSGNIYVSDKGGSRIEKFTSSGVYLAQFGSYGTGNGQFINPSALTFDSSGNIYVVDEYNNRVEKFASGS